MKRTDLSVEIRFGSWLLLRVVDEQHGLDAVLNRYAVCVCVRVSIKNEQNAFNSKSLIIFIPDC